MKEAMKAKKARLALELVALEEELDAAENIHWGIMKQIEAKHSQIDLLSEGGAA